MTVVKEMSDIKTLREACDHLRGLHRHMTMLRDGERAKLCAIRDALGMAPLVNPLAPISASEIIAEVDRLKNLCASAAMS